MTGTRALVIGFLGALAFAASARAADMPGNWGPPPPDLEKPMPRYTELMSGWYIRGDLSYRFNRVGSVDAGSPVVSMNYPNSLGGTLGVGYKYKWFRTDLTFDYAWPVHMTATTATATTQPQYTTRFDATSVLANGYIDLGTWAGFTPYVGAGVGGSYLRSKVYIDTTRTPNGNLVGTKTNLSWAWMAGVSYQILPNWVVDVGFRHLSLGDVPSTTGTAAVTDSTTWRKLSTQEVRIGLRLLFD